MAAPEARPASGRPDAGSRGATSRGVPDAGQRASPQTPRAPSSRAGTLLIYSKGFDKRIVDLYNEAHFASTGKTKQIDSWPEIVAAIGQYQSINHLVFLVHSAPGMFLFRPDANARTFGDHMLLVDAARKLEALPTRPQIQTVDLAGCNLGFHLNGVLQFGLATSASEIIATNHFHEFALMQLKARAGAAKQIDRLDKDLARLRGYVMTPNADALVERASDSGVDRLVLLEWFAGSKDEHPLMLPNTAGIDTDKRAKVFKRYSDTFSVVVWNQKALDAVRDDFFTFAEAGGPPVTTLTRVTIELQQFRETADGVRQPNPSGPPRDAGPQGNVVPRREVAPRALPAGDRARRPPASGSAGYTRARAFLEPGDRAIVDEVFRRGGSVGDAMGVFYARNLVALKGTDLGVPPLGTSAVPPLGASANPSRGTTRPRFTLEDRLSLDARDLSDTQQRRTDQVEALRQLIEARLKAYEASVKIEFNSIRRDVTRNFKPIKVAPYIDPDTTADEKYRRMRGAYYRAGWTCMKRDVFDRIVPTTFFGATIEGGAHSEMSELLGQVERAVRASNPGVADQLKAGGFVIGGFVPRFQAGSDQLSNHSWGLAIDSDATWNPQLKSPKARSAFKRATGDDFARPAYPASAADAVDKTYDRIAAMSKRLMTWLNEWMPKYKLLEEDRRAARAKKDERKLAALSREITANPDLAALQTLIDEYTRKTVDSWQAYGIVTIPKEIVKAFLRLGKKNGARWGGQYEDTKDIMHLELQWLGQGSPSRPGGPGRRKAVVGFDDLVQGETPREPRCPLPVHAPAPKPQPRPATQPVPSTRGRIQLGQP